MSGIKEIDRIELFFLAFGYFEYEDWVKQTIQELKAGSGKKSLLPKYEKLNRFYINCQTKHRQNIIDNLINSHNSNK